MLVDQFMELLPGAHFVTSNIRRVEPNHFLRSMQPSPCGAGLLFPALQELDVLAISTVFKDIVIQRGGLHEGIFIAG